MNSELSNQAKTEICRIDFYNMLGAACRAAGGGQVEKLKQMKFEDVVNLLAHNGIRMVYMSERHMDAISVEWKAKPTGRREDGPLGRKKLLLDATHGTATYTDPLAGYDPLEGNRG